MISSLLSIILRWIIRYHENVMCLPEFQRDCYSLKRTKEAFSVGATDFALELNAASQWSGVSSITNSNSARQRSADSHFFRTKIISMLYDQLGMTKKEGRSRDLKPNQMKKNAQDFSKIFTIEETIMNPFSGKSSEGFLCKEAATKETTQLRKNLLWRKRKVHQRMYCWQNAWIRNKVIRS